MKTENWCVVTLDDNDLQGCRVDGGKEVVLAEKTTKVIIKVEKTSDMNLEMCVRPAPLKRTA